MEELRFATTDIEVVVLPEAGGRLHRIRAFGIDVMRTPDDPATHLREPFVWGGYPMVPWGGRLSSGPLEVDGRVVDLPSNQPDGWALHGQAYDVPWQRVDDATLRFAGGREGGWPWAYEAQMSFAVEGAALTLDMRLTNTDDAPMPAGMALHPWFAGPPLLRIPANLAYDDNRISSPLATPVEGRLDLRTLRELEVGVDNTWTGLSEHATHVAWPDTGMRGEMSASSTHGLVFVAARLPGIDAFALEPQTHAPMGLRRMLNDEPDPMTRLAPGETLRLITTFSFSRQAN